MAISFGSGQGLQLAEEVGEVEAASVFAARAVQTDQMPYRGFQVV